MSNFPTCFPPNNDRSKDWRRRRSAFAAGCGFRLCWQAANRARSGCCSKSNYGGLSWLNADVEERRDEREEKQAVSLQPAQKPRIFVREISEPCINSE